MEKTGSQDDVFMDLVDLVNLYTDGDLSVVEVVNTIFMRLAESSRFDLVSPVVDILPSPVRKELRRIVEDIREGGGTYRPFILGRASEEWWEQIRQRIRHLADLFKPLLEIGAVPKGHTDDAAP